MEIKKMEIVIENKYTLNYNDLIVDDTGIYI
jgi:hypothetical protein